MATRATHTLLRSEEMAEAVRVHTRTEVTKGHTHTHTPTLEDRRSRVDRPTYDTFTQVIQLRLSRCRESRSRAYVCVCLLALA